MYRSHLARGAWIEMLTRPWPSRKDSVAPRKRCVDWNVFWLCSSSRYIKSHLARGAWIEIHTFLLKKHQLNVAPRKRCVDWNRMLDDEDKGEVSVAPRKRCVDWNSRLRTQRTSLRRSHLARGAWIEIIISFPPFSPVRRRTSQEVRGLKSLCLNA